MTGAVLRLSEQAEADLTDIWVYIAADSPASADAFTQRLYDKCVLLAETPTLGRARPELGEGVRSFPFKRYVIYYRHKLLGSRWFEF